jgi:hypothetical protein
MRVRERGTAHQQGVSDSNAHYGSAMFSFLYTSEMRGPAACAVASTLMQC